MRGGYLNLLSEVGASRVASVIEQQKARHSEECERRLAVRQNSGNAVNTPWPSKDKAGKWQSLGDYDSGR